MRKRTVRKEAKNNQNSVVWAFSPQKQDLVISGKESPFEGRRTKVFQPNHVTRRIVVQGGWFTVHKYIQSKGRFIPLEKNKLYKKRLIKFIIPPSSFQDLRYDLDRCGINDASLFPGLYGLCKHIVWEHSLLSDETVYD